MSKTQTDTTDEEEPMTKDERKAAATAALRTRKFEKHCDYARAHHIKAEIGDPDIQLSNVLTELVEEGSLTIRSSSGSSYLYRITIDEGGERTDEERRHLTKGELREEIAYAVGGDHTRYGYDTHKGLKKADMYRIATALQPDDDTTDLRECVLGELLELACEWAGGEHRPHGGCPWGLRRENLKKIHAAVGGRDPRDVPEP